MTYLCRTGLVRVGTLEPNVLFVSSSRTESAVSRVASSVVGAESCGRGGDTG